MASAPVNVRVGVGAGGASARQEPESPRRVVVERPIDPEDVDPEEVAEHAPKKRPTMREIVERAASVADLGSVAADNLGAEDAAETMRRGADVARKRVAAVEGVRREVEPAVTAAKGLWRSMEEKGWVGVRKPIDIASMQKRNRGSKKKSEAE